MTVYDNQFFNALHGSSLPAARATVPRLVRLLAPRSVADVGCGTGIWLAEFLRCGAPDVLGIDGPWVPEPLLQVPTATVLRHDLNAPLISPRRFDLVLCLRVAEHLPKSAADTLVSTLIALGDVVLFNAAPPGARRSADRNEQAPSWWDRLFADQGYLAVRGFGDHLARVREVDAHYSRNLAFYVRKGSAVMVDLGFRHLQGPAHPVRLDDILPVVMTCARDLELTGRFVDSYAEKIAEALPHPLVSIDLTPGPDLPAEYLARLARLESSAVLTHPRRHDLPDRESIADAAYFVLQAGLDAREGRGHLLLVEDDTIFSSAFLSHLSTLRLPADAGLYTFYRPAGRSDSPVIDARQFLGTQCVLVPVGAVREILNDRVWAGPTPATSYDRRWAQSLALACYTLYGSTVSYVQHIGARSRYGSSSHRSGSFVP